MTTLTVDLDAIEANWRTLAAHHDGPVAGVVKADAYGMGAERVGARLHAAGARHFFVAYPEEGAVLRRHVPGALLAILNGFFPDQADTYLRHDLAPVLGTGAELQAFSALAARVDRRLPALLHVDTGMNRLGFSQDAFEALVADPVRLAGIDVRFVMTHLASAETPEDPLNAGQAARFAAACRLLPGIAPSFANSSGVFGGPAFRSRLARPGAALYGINPRPGTPNPMRPVMRLSARVLQVRDIPPGASVGYNATWTARRPTRVATVSAGYADGYHRSLSGRAAAAFDGRRLPLIGRVSMDLATFDATDHPGVVEGVALELIGPAIPPDEVAVWAGTNGYEILTSLRPRHGRVHAAL